MSRIGGTTMGRKICIVFFVLLLVPVLCGVRVLAAGDGAKNSGKDDNGIEKKLSSFTENFKEQFEDLFSGEMKMELPEEDRLKVRKTYLKLYKLSFNGFFLNLKERFPVIRAKFGEETKGCGSILVIAFLVTSVIQGANNKVVIGRHLHLYEGKVSERYRIRDEHLSESRLVGKLVWIALILEGLMLVAVIFKSDGILFRNLFKLNLHDTLWRAVAYGCIRLLLSFLAMLIPFIIAYIIALPITVIREALSERTYERGPTFHAQALDLLDNRIVLGVLGFFSGLVFIHFNFVSWFIYLEAAGLIK